VDNCKAGNEGLQGEAWVLVGRDKLVWDEMVGAAKKHLVAEIFIRDCA